MAGTPEDDSEAKPAQASTDVLKAALAASQEALAVGDAAEAERIAKALLSIVKAAEALAALYERGRVSNVGVSPELEAQMCAFGAPDFSGSPDRLDAAVWAIADLMIGRSAPSLRIV